MGGGAAIIDRLFNRGRQRGRLGSAAVDPVPEALKSEALVVPTESLDLDGRIARLHRKLKPFIERVIGAAS